MGTHLGGRKPAAICCICSECYLLQSIRRGATHKLFTVSLISILLNVMLPFISGNGRDLVLDVAASELPDQFSRGP
jgi:hypothetical protein